ncbi:Putative ATP-dependent Lon protease [Nitrosotalea devaniterrae]|uniref:ATP-dependent Lon protease n=1 Tax=Nitrosotalea devaniterrae TaxID=1078905 RepID=A0A128A3B1_9ARCH|nr:Putative ATP-dependent Lon protease [Candidatus Nitrosotalea devanaterra]
MILKRPDARGETIMKFLQNNGNSTFREINMHLIEKGLEYQAKGLNRKLSDMIKDDLIERLEQKPRTLYRIRIDSHTISKIHGMYFKESMKSRFQINFEKIFNEISDTDKMKNITPEQSYVKTCIEFLGLYVFVALIESTIVPMKIQKQTNDKKGNELRKTWLSNTLSLEDGIVKTSLTFEKMIKYFKRSKDESNPKTRQRIMSSFIQLYPQTSGIILDSKFMEDIDNFLDILKQQKYSSLKELSHIFGIMTGETNRKTRDDLIMKAREKKTREIYSKNN